MELLWREKSLLRNNSITKYKIHPHSYYFFSVDAHHHTAHFFPLPLREVNVTLPLSTLKNGSLYGHVFLAPSGRNPLHASDRPYMSVSVVTLTRYAVPKDTTFNLLSGGSGEVADHTLELLIFWPMYGGGPSI